MNLEQTLHNLKVDEDIRLSRLEHELYLNECELQRKQFELANPTFPKDKLPLMFLPVKAPRQICAIRYIN